MIPYTGFTTIQFGPIPIYVWGLLVACGFVVGMLVAQYIAKKKKLDPNIIANLALLAVVAGFIGARIGHVFFYDFPYYREHILEIFALWKGGLSSFGGFLGSAMVILWWYRKHKKEAWEYFNVLAFTFPLAWGIGRIGCFLIHDHPGVCTNFFLGMEEPKGLCAARYDLGLYESIQGFLIFIIFLLLAKYSKKRDGKRYVAWLFVLYAIPRFFFDFLRISEGPLADARYFALTPAQYGSIVVAVAGVYLLMRVRA